jgi:hypothetical protein
LGFERPPPKGVVAAPCRGGSRSSSNARLKHTHSSTPTIQQVQPSLQVYGDARTPKPHVALLDPYNAPAALYNLAQSGQEGKHHVHATHRLLHAEQTRVRQSTCEIPPAHTPNEVGLQRPIADRTCTHPYVQTYTHISMHSQSAQVPMHSECRAGSA